MPPTSSTLARSFDCRRPSKLCPVHVLSLIHISTNTTYVGTVVGYDLSEDVALIQLKGASGLTTIKTVNSDNVSSGEKIVGIGNAEGLGGTPSYVAGTVVALDQAITAGDETNRCV